MADLKENYFSQPNFYFIHKINVIITDLIFISFTTRINILILEFFSIIIIIFLNYHRNYFNIMIEKKNDYYFRIRQSNTFTSH